MIIHQEGGYCSVARVSQSPETYSVRVLVDRSNNKQGRKQPHCCRKAINPHRLLRDIEDPRPPQNDEHETQARHDGTDPIPASSHEILVHVFSPP